MLFLLPLRQEKIGGDRWRDSTDFQPNNIHTCKSRDAICVSGTLLSRHALPYQTIDMLSGSSARLTSLMLLNILRRTEQLGANERGKVFVSVKQLRHQSSNASCSQYSRRRIPCSDYREVLNDLKCPQSVYSYLNILTTQGSLVLNTVSHRPNQKQPVLSERRG